MALLKDLIVTGASKFISDAYFNTIKAGTWNGNVIGLAYGGLGTNASSVTKAYVFAAPAAANGAPSFRALTAADVGLGNITNTALITDLEIYTGKSDAKNREKSLTNGNVYLKMDKTVNGDTLEDSKIKVTGTGFTTVTTDSDGGIKVNSPTVKESSFIVSGTTYAIFMENNEILIGTRAAITITFTATSVSNKTGLTPEYGTRGSYTATATPLNKLTFSLKAADKSVTLLKMTVSNGTSTYEKTYTNLIAAGGSLSSTTLNFSTETTGVAAAQTKTISYEETTDKVDTQYTPYTAELVATLYYNEGGVDKTYSVKLAATRASASITGRTRRFIYFTLATGTTLAASHVTSSLACYYSTSLYTGNFTLAGTSSAKKDAYIAFPQDSSTTKSATHWGTPSVWWNGNPDNGWVATSITQTINGTTYKVYKYTNVLASSYTWNISAWS